MPVKLQNSFSPQTEVGAALNNAITTYGNNIPTYGEAQAGRVNQNKADSPQQVGDALRALYSGAGAGQQLTPQMVQDNLPALAQSLTANGSVSEVGNLLRTAVANSASPESTQMIDRSQEGAGQAYGTTETGTKEKEANDITKTNIQQQGANLRAQIAANSKGGAQQLKLDAAAKGKQDLSGILKDIDDRMQLLDKGGDYTDSEGNTQHADGGAIPSVGGGTLHNMVASASAGPIGQYIGGKVGSTSQSLRNDINSRLPLIKQAVMSATGMSSKQLDSNVELKTFMQALSDPAKDVQSNRGTLRNLDKLYGTGSLANGGAPSSGQGNVSNAGAVEGGDSGGGDQTWTDPTTGTTYHIGPDGQPYE